MIKRLLRKYCTWKYAKSQHKEVFKEGTLLNAFYKSKTIFIHIPKTAGVSLLKAIYGDVTLSGHRNFYFNRIALNIKNEKYFSFAFVRNPWDRLYSAYKFLEKGGINIHDKNAYEMYLSQYKNFEDFVINGLDQKIIYEITHFTPQSEFICNNKGEVLVDYLGKFESLNQDIITLSKELKTEVIIGHHNSNSKQDYTNVYTDRMIAKVQDIYKKDIDIFNYDFK